MHLLHQLPLGAHREQDLDQARAQQPFRRDGRAPLGRIEPVELGIEAGQRFVDDLAHRAQRVPGRDPLLKVDIAEQRPRHLVRPAHPSPPKPSGEDESRPENRVEGRVLQQPVSR